MPSPGVLVAGQPRRATHIENAMRYGATVGELVETLEVTALSGIASLRAAAPLILEIFGSDE